jgi:hypothetical protein
MWIMSLFTIRRIRGVPTDVLTALVMKFCLLAYNTVSFVESQPICLLYAGLFFGSEDGGYMPL